MRYTVPTKSELARLGFVDLTGARDGVSSLLGSGEFASFDWLQAFRFAADPDLSLQSLLSLIERNRETVLAIMRDTARFRSLVMLLGVSTGFGGFLERNPIEMTKIPARVTSLPSAEQLRADLLRHVGADASGLTTLPDEEALRKLRLRYRHWLLRIALFDLDAISPIAVQPTVSAALADLAGAALDASLACARARIQTGALCCSAQEVAATRLAIIGMGKTGARELNYISDVDVIFVAKSADTEVVSDGRAVEVATRLAVTTMRGIDEYGVEPPLWEVDANLRPEGKDGALVRTLDSHVAYYDRWAKSWEFQALLKARPIAGDQELGERYMSKIWPLVWNSAGRDNFVESVQKMRERVTDHIPEEQVDRQIKLGPGGIRDVEFTVQLLQLVHGQHDDSIRQADTLSALAALAESGYIGRAEAEGFGQEYRRLRLLEHRVQLRHLKRTHLMPVDETELRVLARASKAGTTANEVVKSWQKTRQSVRTLHERLFYRPLLSAVAKLSEEDLALTSDQAQARLAAIGFLDPAGALSHLAALTKGISRRAEIQKHLLPIMLQWFAEGNDPDYALLTFRKISEKIGEAYWYLRMLRDSPAAAKRLSRVLSSSRFVGERLVTMPESVQWLAEDRELTPRDFPALEEEISALVSRHENTSQAAKAIMSVRRREVLRLAMSNVLGIFNSHEIGRGLSHVTTAVLRGVLASLNLERELGIEFGIIAMGRYGGMELGFASDIDVIYVYRARQGVEDHDAATNAQAVAKSIKMLTEDFSLPLDIDLDLRPEGKNGPTVRSLDSYRAYYQRWSSTWEAQALIRANPVAGSESLLSDFVDMIDPIRYPAELSVNDVREIRRIKARVESERLPKGSDPLRHLKLGRGSLSDVEWLTQLLQLQHAHEHPALKTTSTLDALAYAAGQGFLTEAEAEILVAAWRIASRTRSATTLATGKTSDVLPTDMHQLEAIARLLDHPKGSAAWFENDYLAKTRRARQVFENRFYGSPTPYFSRPR